MFSKQLRLRSTPLQRCRIIQRPRLNNNTILERPVRLVDRAAAVAAEVGGQFVAALVVLRVRVGGAGCDFEVGRGDHEVEGMRAAADFAAGEAVACCLFEVSYRAWGGRVRFLPF